MGPVASRSEILASRRKFLHTKSEKHLSQGGL